VKALAKKTAQTAQPAETKGPARVAASADKTAAVQITAKRPAKTLSQPATAAKPAVKAVTPAAKPAAPSAKSSAKVVSKPAVPAKTSTPVTPTAKLPSKAIAKTSPNALVRSDPQTASKSVTKSATPSSAKAPIVSKPAAVTVPTAAKPVKPVAVAPAAKAVSPVAKAASSKAQAAQAAVQPTPRPLGKRAAKKVMMEQMTQAEVVPTHSADAAKATFSNMNERVVVTPPVPSAIRKDPKRANNWKTLPVGQLTDEDILAMPDEEYMGELQLAYFRRKLIQLRDDMLANAGETTEHLREDTVVVPDPADRATIEEEHALELRTRDRERKLLKKIEQAIGRIDNGDYGYCDETGETIGVGRLMARPTASLSLEAQQRRELKQKMFGD
jgi:DnaK suppressor protein